MCFDKSQLKAINIYLLYQISYPEDVNIVLRRNKKNGIVTSIIYSPQKEFDLEDYLKFNELNQYIKSFYFTIKNYLPHVTLSAFEKNIKSLKITSEEKTPKEVILEMLFREIVGAEYDSKSNHIKFYPKEYEKLGEEKEDFIESAITHELLHVASTYKKGLIRISGFSQALANVYEVGYGINEGFTEYLNCKYFNKKAIPAYEDIQSLTMGIVQIVGEETMEKLYFEGNLAGLINELSKYQSEEESLELIYNIDKVQRESKPTKRKQLIEDITSTITTLYIRKQEGQTDTSYQKKLGA